MCTEHMANIKCTYKCTDHENNQCDSKCTREMIRRMSDCDLSHIRAEMDTEAVLTENKNDHQPYKIEYHMASREIVTKCLRQPVKETKKG